MNHQTPYLSWLVCTSLASALACTAELGPTDGEEPSEQQVATQGVDPVTGEPLPVGVGSVTGAGPVVGAGSSSGVPMSGAGGSPSPGTGGVLVAGGGNSASGGVSSGGTNTASGGTSAGGTSTGGASPSNCGEYPAGPYERVRNLEIGDVLPPDLSWTGYDLEGNWRTVTMAELHDCDGSQGRNALIFRNVAVWCGVCEALNRRLNSELDDGWRADGVEAYVLVSEDAQSNEATDTVTRAYYDAFEPDGWAVLTDSDWTFLGTVGGGALPMQIVVDPRTMTLQGTTSGGADIPNGLTEVLERNR